MAASLSIVNITKELLLNAKKQKRVTYKEIAEATGIDESWIKSFASKSYESIPAADKIEKMYYYATGKRLAEIASI
jgi:transcriptional regulator with XRE-family HTH domain